ncbi:MAG: hypothetical protein DME08_20745, partial [Candidatus Rokuibacteriota bacterium]
MPAWLDEPPGHRRGVFRGLSLVVDVHGHCEPPFEPLRVAIADILAAGSEVGVSLAVYAGKQAVVDVWGGHTDAARTRPWAADTIVNLYS